MTVFVILDAQHGSAARYESVSGRLYRTHRAGIDTPYEFTLAEVALMRDNPMSEHAHKVEVPR